MKKTALILAMILALLMSACGQPASTGAPSAPAPESAVSVAESGQPASGEVPASSEEAPAPASQAPASSSEAPASSSEAPASSSENATPPAVSSTPSPAPVPDVFSPDSYAPADTVPTEAVTVRQPITTPRTTADLASLYLNDTGTAQVPVYVDDGTIPRPAPSYISSGGSGGKAPANTGEPEDQVPTKRPAATANRLPIASEPQQAADAAQKAPELPDGLIKSAPEPGAPKKQVQVGSDEERGPDGMIKSVVPPPPVESFPGNAEEYTGIKETGFLSAAANPLSTFAVEADTAAYSNIRRLIVQGAPVEPDAVRIEEMINYFHYDYPAPDGPDPFSVTTEMAPCPWNPNTRLLLVGLQAKELDMSARKPSNIVYLLDVSGSMDEADKLPLVKRAFSLLTENLQPDDRISIVTYASSDAVILQGAKGSDQYTVMTAIEGLNAAGSTYGSKGIQTAYRIARENFIEGGINRVILATDGDLNVGLTTEDELAALVTKERESGVFLSVLGFGYGNLKDSKMEALAKNGNGNYYYIDSLLEAKKVLVEQLGGTLNTVAKDVKIQVEFNPKKVKGYRLLGYENRMLAAEDFMDDTKDAGEIGAGHRVTALYEIADIDSKQKIGGVNLKYRQSAGSGNEWLTVKIRYKQPDGVKSKELDFPVSNSAYRETASQNLRFAGAVAQAGMLLRESEYAGSASYDGVLRQLEQIPALSEDGYKQEFKLLVQLLAEAEKKR